MRLVLLNLIYNINLLIYLLMIYNKSVNIKLLSVLKLL